MKGFQTQYLTVTPVVPKIRQKTQWSGTSGVPELLVAQTHRSRSLICRKMPWDFEGFGWVVGLFEQRWLILERESERAGELKCGCFGGEGE